MSLKERAQEVLTILQEGKYSVDGQVVRISDAQQHAVEQSRLYTPEQLMALRSVDQRGEPPEIRVVSNTTQVEASDLAQNGSVCLLNFASARNPGGGFLTGAKAQEEDLCRCSGLYPTLTPHSEYYAANRQQSSMLYTDHAIYSPCVPFFRTRGTGALLQRPFTASVITMSAPNSGPHLQRGGTNEELQRAFERRWENVLLIAADQNQSHLLLGAWGCGAFQGDPVMAAETAGRAISRWGGGFRSIVFAIPGTGKRSAANLAAFERAFS